MLLSRLFLWALCLAALPLSRGGQYGTQFFSSPDGTVDLMDGSTLGADQPDSISEPVTAVLGNALRLSSAAITNSVSSYKLPDLNPGNVASTLDIRFTVRMTASGEIAAGEGWSLNFGNIPKDNGTGEGGFAPLTGLTVAFDPLDNGAGDSPSIEIFVDGVSLTNVLKTFVLDTSPRVVLFHWDASGLDLSYDNRVICSDLPVPGFAPRPGDTFAFTSRATTHAMDVFLDDLTATTEALPVIETGGPIISEFVANNSDLEDEFAGKPGWIELFNGSSSPVDLTGWYLTDSKKNLTKWRLNGIVLNPYNYQIAFASGRDRQLSPTSFLHTSFTMAKSGGYLALVKPDGLTVASDYEYGPQEKNVAFGESGLQRRRGYLYPASPGAVNTAEPSANSFAPPVQFSKPSGFIAEAVEVALTVPAFPNAEIRYTLDRTEPGPASALYAGPLSVTLSTTIRARAYLPDHLPGRVTRATFVKMDATLTDYAGTGKVFDSNLPLVYLDSFGINVDGSTGGSRPFRPSFALVISPDPATGRASLTNRADYAGPAGVHVRGESSAGFDQKSYALEIWDETNEDLDAGLVDLPADSDWVLYGPWSEKTLMRNKLVFDWMIALRGHDGTAVRTRFVELFFNQRRTSVVGYDLTYRGIYVLMEKLKRGKDRLPLENLNDKTIDPDLITGGYIFRKDKPDSLKSNWSTSRYGIPLQSFDPDRLNTAQFTYLRNYINDFEITLNSSNFRDFRTGYRAFIDPDTFIDAQWMLEISKQVDGYVFSTYFHKDRAGRMRAGPLWDFNIALGNADYGTGDRSTGWLYDNANGAGQLWYPKFHADPEYKLAHWDRYWQLRRSLFATDAVMAAIDRNMTLLLDGYTGAISNRAPAEIQNPVARHFRRWPRLGSRDWPNPPGETKIRTWQQEVDYMRDWIRPRLEWLDDQSLRTGRFVYRPPMLSHPGGEVGQSVALAMSCYDREDPVYLFPSGDIYYTLDNSDPRLSGGEILHTARKYAGPVTVNRSLTVKARVFANGVWSPLATSSFLLRAIPASAANLVISEILFRPAPLSGAETAAGLVDPNQCEFLELRNIATNTVDLSGVRVVDGVGFDFNYAPRSSCLLQPGESRVLVSDSRAFQIRFPDVPESRVLGQFTGHLDSGGETLEIQAANGSTIKRFRYDDDAPWPSGGDRTGRSIILLNAATNPDEADPAAWTVSAKPGGTPGVSGLGADAFAGDPLRDTDGDGQTDYFEFASGSDPENPNSSFYPVATIQSLVINGNSGNFLTFTFTHRANPSPHGFKYESSQDLQNWDPANLIPINATINNDGTSTENYRESLPLARTGARFYRLKAE